MSILKLNNSASLPLALSVMNVGDRLEIASTVCSLQVINMAVMREKRDSLSGYELEETSDAVIVLRIY